MTIDAFGFVNALKAQISANRQNLASMVDQDILNRTR
jgi:hypothetical protein